jgi:hypothetical protein
MPGRIIALLNLLISVLRDFFLYRAGRTSMRASQQQGVLDDITTARRTADSVRALSDAAVGERLRRDWTRQ